MRVEFYGCRTDKCKMPLGLEDFRIDSGALTASSYVNYNHGPDRARLNWPSGHSRSGAWVAKHRNTNQWLQVELAHPAKITGVATQGRYDAYQWVTTYAVSHSMDGKTFKAYLEYGRNKLFSGNYNRYTIVKHDLTPPIRAKFVRFNPKGYRTYIAMRIELYGCYYGGAQQGRLIEIHDPVTSRRYHYEILKC
ncbi:lactadherin-like [Montipora capricornis]|uniref:lactadherin-like n=1 Tax=Montipora capricornis TaxID=246305 RepID=UPI0035F1C5B5